MDFEDKEIDLLGKTTEAYEKIFEIGLESV